jgi:hypothetical protein
MRHLASLRVCVVATTVGLALIATGCGQADYPASVQRNFMDACEANGGATKKCECAIDKLQSELSFDDYKKEEAAITAGNTPSRKITDAIAECQ